MRLCRYFQRNSACIPFISRLNSIRSFYLTAVLIIISWRGIKPEVEYHANSINLRFICTSYRSLYLLSSLALVRLCDVLFLVVASIILTFTDKSYLLQSYCTRYYQNPYIFSSHLAYRILEGLNLTHLVFIVCSKMRFLSIYKIDFVPNGIGLIFSGRIKTYMITRFVAKINALSLSSFTNTILDIGIISSLSSLGLLGVKIGTIIQFIELYYMINKISLLYEFVLVLKLIILNIQDLAKDYLTNSIFRI